MFKPEVASYHKIEKNNLKIVRDQCKLRVPRLNMIYFKPHILLFAFKNEKLYSILLNEHRIFLHIAH